jgi:hypothetical protein
MAPVDAETCAESLMYDVVRKFVQQRRFVPSFPAGQHLDLRFTVATVVAVKAIGSSSARLYRDGLDLKDGAKVPDEPSTFYAADDFDGPGGRIQAVPGLELGSVHLLPLCVASHLVHPHQIASVLVWAVLIGARTGSVKPSSGSESTLAEFPLRHVMRDPERRLRPRSAVV